MTEIVAADIGGTNARFALAEVDNGRVLRLDTPVTLKTADHGSLELAWAAFADRLGRALPRRAGIAVAGPVTGAVLKLTNNPWIIRPAALGQSLGLDDFALINDFGAVGHAVAQSAPTDLRHLCGPDRPIDADEVVSIVGPGTGLGVAQIVRRDGRTHVIETEGGHIDFAPLDPLEDRLLGALRRRFRRVSVERLAAGPGLANLYAGLAAIEGRAVRELDDATLWPLALSGEDALASAALERLCLILGAVSGDIALAHGAGAVVIAGGVGLRLADHLPRSGFDTRFVAKGRFEGRMAAMPVKLITVPEPGLLGAAAAFAQRHA